MRLNYGYDNGNETVLLNRSGRWGRGDQGRSEQRDKGT
jgi:hypothetical protein